MNKVILSINDLAKYFGDFAALSGIDLGIKSDSITSIIGPNGAGKTTLINVITGALRPNKGKIYFNGDDITHWATDKLVRKRITRSYQIMNIFPRLTVFQNIELAIFPLFGKNFKWFYPTDKYSDVTEEVSKVLEEVKLIDKKNMLAGELSHGDQRLLELGIAIAPRPELCFLDEPSSGMNPLESTKVLELIKELGSTQKITFVVVEHDMDLVFSLSDWIIVMNKGEILTENEPEKIRKDENVKEIYLGDEL
jgi:branched-chain amino acid transport system ATP-binding protein